MKKHAISALIFSAVLSLTGLVAAENKEAPFFWTDDWTFFLLTADYPGYKIIDSFSGLSGSKDFKPWTGQIRVAGFADNGDGVTIAVNTGFPLVLSRDSKRPAALKVPGRNAADQFLQYSKNLTTGLVFSDDEQVVFHLYRDDLFSSGSAVSAQLHGHPVLLKFGADESGSYNVETFDFDFHKENPEWEPVEYLRKSDGGFVAWKYSDDKKTRFRYIKHGKNGESIAEIDESFFRDEYNLRSIEDGSFALRGFLRAVREGVTGPELEEAGDIYLGLSSAPSEIPDGGLPVFYYAARGSSRTKQRLPVQLQACPDGDLWYILSGDEILVCSTNIDRWKLPDLPEGFAYEQLWVNGRDMIVSWEERRFPFIGCSGMMYFRLRDIIN